MTDPLKNRKLPIYVQDHDQDPESDELDDELQH